MEDGAVKCLFYPLDDVDGFVELLSIKVNGITQAIQSKGDIYCPKGKSEFVLDLSGYDNKVTVEIIWQEKIKEWL